MQIEAHLEYDAVLAQPTQPVHLALRLEAPELSSRRARPVAFSLVLDRSGSMIGDPLEHAKEAARMVVRHLRKDDLFALTVFDNEALTLLPLGPIHHREAVLELIDAIDTGGSTNLSGGWMLGRDALKTAPDGMPRRLLLFTDGQMNAGLTDPAQVHRIVGDGLESHAIRTSCLGFGDHYEEDLLTQLAAATNGSFYDAASPERLPAIFAAELEGLQRLAVQNLRIRLRRLMLCEGVVLYTQSPCIAHDPETVEITLGDLISGEQRTVLFGLQLCALPPGPDGRPLVTLEEESLVELLLTWEALTDDGVSSHTSSRTIRARRVQDPADATLNAQMIPWIATQHAAQAAGEAVEAVDRGEIEAARQGLRAALRRLEDYPASADTEDGQRLLRETLERLEAENGLSARSRKLTRATSRDYSEMSSGRYASTAELNEDLPHYKRRPDNGRAAED
ncbi:MAG: vWA domain-containing protein [Verrucomicrobiota bacterium]